MRIRHRLFLSLSNSVKHKNVDVFFVKNIFIARDKKYKNSFEFFIRSTRDRLSQNCFLIIISSKFKYDNFSILSDKIKKYWKFDAKYA